MDWINILDHECFSWVQQYMRHPMLDYWFVLFRDKHTWIPLYVFLLSFLFFNYGKEAWKVLLMCILLITITDQLNSNLIKKSVQRQRPCNESFFNETYQAAIDCSGGYSFPSSHATNHMGLAVFLFLWFRKSLWRHFLLLWAALVGFSQVYVGVHFPFDVMAGFMEGAIIAFVLYSIYIKFFAKNN
ncbi:MAG: phosphatase PAP2 family protein [Saprospiraceae bacterium]|nr:phosphatase PAP2 family protein [Saprospiraceae bacterium]